MLYLGQCRGISPPDCQPCTPPGCDACTTLMLDQACDGEWWSQEFIVDESDLAIGTISSPTLHGTCGSGLSYYNTYDYADLSISVPLNTPTLADLSDVEICGARMYSTCFSAECAAVAAIDGFDAAWDGTHVHVSVDAIRIPVVASAGGVEPASADWLEGIIVVVRCTWAGSPAYLRIYLPWTYATGVVGASVNIVAPCVGCPSEVEAYDMGYDAGYGCMGADPPTCSTEANVAYEAGYADGWADGACDGGGCPTVEDAYWGGYYAGGLCGDPLPPDPEACGSEVYDAYMDGYGQGYLDADC